ncbi:P-loop nucleoside triphosphate hydrolases superfamily protein with CH (Calponin Homology) domain-containing protein [Actinidia rufa]|uniref:P-loop nucleoside triphosphate hydrolases superfamily protein with CH (Calponin Homology) domain-containing protein n=1 Tax=Actinidia rufa TaxID=165716 RepID=A0A7J0FRQ5_9ERIC|nr:P-loop nucleoside triphosphate hydrolases superfamily protein with CH (Calponin Homology) domain-containing protein [Actinidia rufa]
MAMMLKKIENKFRVVSHSKQGCSAEIPAGKMSELMKLNSLQQNNRYKILEEKYQSRIQVLETLATGTLEENENEKIEIEEKKKLEEQDVIRLMQEKDHAEFQISALKQQLELAKKTHEMHCFQLETQAKETKVELEKKLMELEYLLTDSRDRIKDLEAFSESKSLRWKKKELTYKRVLDSQSGLLQDLRIHFWAIKREVLKTQQVYSEEFCHLAVKLKGLVDVAENYHTILVENRKLYNEVQDLKGNIRVYCRIRPFLPGQCQKKTTIEYIGENGELVVSNPLKQGKDNHRLFKFNKVFGLAATQEEVFLDTQPLIRSVLDGYNVCIFAYGQTGSGKTYTMSGPNLSTEDWGVNYRALNDLFHISQSRKNSIAYEVCVQMVEIYNERVPVPDASIHPVKSTEDILELMNIGLMNRAVGSTALNERSSRSHSVLTVHVRGIDLESDTVLRGCLHLVDLAGSERVDRSEATGDRLREAQHINKSLSALGDVIFSLAQKSPHVPYRNSKLTQVLQSSLGGQAKTLMFVQLNPDVESYSETISTLKFAERVSGVELGAAQSNKEGRGVRELMEQVASLKDTIAKKDEEIGRLRLLKTGVNGERHGMSSPRYGSSSPRRHSIGASRQSRTLSGGKSLELGDKAVSDLDNSSEYSDKQSEDGSQQSVDDFRHHKDFFRQSRFSMADVCQSLTENIEPRLASADRSQDIAEDIELLGLGDADADKRLSDISDGELSMGTETDGSLNNGIVEFTLFPETTKPVADSTEKPSVAAKLPRPPPKQVKGLPSRLSLSRLSSKVPSKSQEAVYESQHSNLKTRSEVSPDMSRNIGLHNGQIVQQFFSHKNATGGQNEVGEMVDVLAWGQAFPPYVIKGLSGVYQIGAHNVPSGNAQSGTLGLFMPGYVIGSLTMKQHWPSKGVKIQTSKARGSQMPEQNARPYSSLDK